MANADVAAAELFDGVEIVSNKTAPVYAEIFARHGDGAAQAMMVGNSMKSDIVPAIEAGGWGVYVPHGLIWELERETPPTGHPRYREIADLSGLAGLIDHIR